MSFSKYHNRKTTIDGILFDSIAESNRYQELKLMKMDHSPQGVKEFTLQPRFELLAPFEKDGKKYRGIYYVADFDVMYNSGVHEIEDVKGFQNAVWKLKAKLFDAKYPELTLVIL